MPELPEVETVRRGLADHLTDRTITRVDVLHPRAVRRQHPDVDLAAVAGRRVEAVRRRGKYLWFALAPESGERPADHEQVHGIRGQGPGAEAPAAPVEVARVEVARVEVARGDAILAHLGMSGQFRFVPAGTPDHPHLRVRLGLDDGRECWFLDQRTFGGMQLSPHGADGPGEIAHIATDLLDPSTDRTVLNRRIRSRHSAIKRVLLDQTVTSGIGNIYADEALWRARVHPERSADRLSRATVEQIIGAVDAVFAEALEAGGTSFDALYVNVNGESGYFDRSLAAYGQTGRPCPRCGTPILRLTFMNRSSHVCPQCQRTPRGQAGHSTLAGVARRTETAAARTRVGRR